MEVPYATSDGKKEAETGKDMKGIFNSLSAGSSFALLCHMYSNDGIVQDAKCIQMC